MLSEELSGEQHLLLARLNHQVAALPQPIARLRNHATLNIQSIRPTIERNPMLVQPGLRRHETDGVRRNVGRVRNQDVDTPAKRPR